MALLSRIERQNLIDLLLRLPNIGSAAARNLLLADLPSELQYAIPFDNAPALHIANIVDTANSDAWAQLPNGSIPLQIVIENALFSVRGSNLAGQLQAMLDTVKSRAAQTGAPTQVPTPPAQEVPDSTAGRSPMNMKLTGAEFKLLQQSLLDIFRSWDDLAGMVRETYNN